jgi:hypothetical protein
MLISIRRNSYLINSEEISMKLKCKLVLASVGTLVVAACDHSRESQTEIQQTAGHRDIQAREVLENFLWEVVDPTGLNCREVLSNTEISNKVTTTLRHKEQFGASTSLIQATQGGGAKKSWLLIPNDAGVCAVRANTQFIKPVPMPMDLPVDASQRISQLRAAFQWMVIDKTNLNCRKAADGNSEVVATLAPSTMIRDRVSDNLTGLSGIKREQDEWAAFEIELDSSNKPWMKLKHLPKGTSTDIAAKATCFVRATRDRLRPSGG